MEDHNATVWGLVLKTQPPSTEHPGQTVDSMSQGPTVCTRRSQFDVRHPQWTHTTPSTSRNPAPKVLLTASRCEMELRSRTGASVWHQEGSCHRPRGPHRLFSGGTALLVCMPKCAAAASHLDLISRDRRGGGAHAFIVSGGEAYGAPR